MRATLKKEQLTLRRIFMSTCIISRRVADVEMMDTMQWTNNGSAVVNNQLITISGTDANTGMVVVAAQAIGAGETGTVIRKMIVEVPKDTSAIAQGQMVQYYPAAASVTMGSTTAGTYGAGLCVEAAASSAGYVKIALNEGPKAFYVW
jgi:predicted RecA/RadA family phage recombinase